MLTHVLRYSCVFSLLSSTGILQAQTISTPPESAESFIREQQRQQQFQQQMQPIPDIRLDTPAENPVQSHLPLQESPCFAINQVQLTGDSASKFQFALHAALTKLDFQAGMCLGEQGINQLATFAQNALLARGFTTTRILVAPQDLNGGQLVLTVIPGRINEIRYEAPAGQDDRAGRIGAFANKFSAKAGDILNLRDLEQGLENLKRLPTAEADIRIEPAAQPNQSDVIIVWQQQLLPYRLSLGVDDAGSRATGKYQGNLTFSADNPLGLSDLFYVSYGRDLGHKASYTDSEGHTTGSGTRSLAVHYSLPFGKWLWALNHNRYRYHQAVAGDSQNYDYNGESFNTDLAVSRSLYRDARRKSSATVKLWKRESNSFIDDAEIEVQRRQTAGWQLGFNHKEYLGNATLNLAAAYKRGTGARQSLRAPEEDWDEGTSRMKIITADADLNLPFSVGKQIFAYDASVHAQWNKTPLIQQDKLAIGGRYTVRGLDGELTLAAERGWYWQNTWSWQYLPAHQLYLGADIGHVSGASAQYLPGQTLAGGVLGLKGQLKAGGRLYYDVFAGKPFKKPAGFETADTTLGFNLTYSF